MIAADCGSPAATDDQIVAADRRQLLSYLPADRLQRSTVKGVLIFVLAGALYLIDIVLAACAPTLWLQLLASLGAGFQTSMLFVIGHDACHGSLTPRPKLNRFIGTLAFLPPLHPYTAWKHTHNGLHHGWTNVRRKDIVYVPFSREEFARLPRWRRLAERFFRSWCGVFAFYFFTVYLPYEIFPDRQRGPRGEAARQAFRRDRILVAAFVVALVASTWVLARVSGRPVWLSLLFTIFVPTACYFALMSFVTFLHHTHPRAPWYDVEELDRLGSVRSSVHVELPRIVEIIFHDILQHTAHHADAMIPLYNLAASQKAIEGAGAFAFTREAWSWSGFLRTLRTCRLYDYETHCWLDFDGRVSSDLPAKLLRHPG
jgi:omega-6 fatty acid desaturase (delta-12 desaturase)